KGEVFARNGRSDLLSYLAAQVSPVVVVALQDPDVSMAREALHGADVATGQIQGFRDSRMTQTVGPHLQPDFAAQHTNHSVKTNPRQSALACFGLDADLPTAMV